MIMLLWNVLMVFFPRWEVGCPYWLHLDNGEAVSWGITEILIEAVIVLIIWG